MCILCAPFYNHLVSIAKQVMLDYQIAGLSACEYRRIMRGEMADLPFFEEQMSRQLRTPEELKPMVSRWDMLEQLVDDDSALISLYYGADVSEEDADAFTEKVTEKYPDVDVDAQFGGQPIYYYVLAVE